MPSVRDRIGGAELAAVAGFQQARPEPGEWFEARGIDRGAVDRLAELYGAVAAGRVDQGEPVVGELLAVFVIGFQTGADAERLRRDRVELPKNPGESRDPGELPGKTGP